MAVSHCVSLFLSNMLASKKELQIAQPIALNSVFTSREPGFRSTKLYRVRCGRFEGKGSKGRPCLSSFSELY